MEGIDTKIEKLEKFYRGQIREMEMKFGKRFHPEVYGTVMCQIIKNSFYGDIEFPEASHRMARMASKLGDYVEIANRYAYRAGMGGRAKESEIFEEFDGEYDKGTAMSCLLEASRLELEDNDNKKKIRFFLANIDDIIKIYENIRLADGYKAYNLKRYCINEVNEGAEEISHLAGEKGTDQEIDCILGLINKSCRYILVNYSRLDECDNAVIYDAAAYNAMANLGKALSNVSCSYFLKISDHEISLAHIRFTNPEGLKRTRAIGYDDVIDLTKVLNGTRCVREFLRKAK